MHLTVLRIAQNEILQYFKQTKDKGDPARQVLNLF